MMNIPLLHCTAGAFFGLQTDTGVTGKDDRLIGGEPSFYLYRQGRSLLSESYMVLVQEIVSFIPVRYGVIYNRFKG